MRAWLRDYADEESQGENERYGNTAMWAFNSVASQNREKRI
jgi:hypothetical protein